ncbi:unnamed protein product, partial [Phaeothamnion confervicola]
RRARAADRDNAAAGRLRRGSEETIYSMKEVPVWPLESRMESYSGGSESCSGGSGRRCRAVKALFGAVVIWPPVLRSISSFGAVSEPRWGRSRAKGSQEEFWQQKDRKEILAGLSLGRGTSGDGGTLAASRLCSGAMPPPLRSPLHCQICESPRCVGLVSACTPTPLSSPSSSLHLVPSCPGLCRSFEFSLPRCGAAFFSFGLLFRLKSRWRRCGRCCTCSACAVSPMTALSTCAASAS